MNSSLSDPLLQEDEGIELSARPSSDLRRSDADEADGDNVNRQQQGDEQPFFSADERRRKKLHKQGAEFVTGYVKKKWKKDRKGLSWDEKIRRWFPAWIRDWLTVPVISPSVDLR
jgi:hypothetical protein